VQLATELRATSIIDVGCGTGLITRELARQGCVVTAVDPAPAMIAIARDRAGCDQVDWIVGGAERVGRPNADLAIMTGHVAQFFVTDDEWHAALQAVWAALRPGGRLAFESRNPDAREWERWTRDFSFVVDDPMAGRIETWSDVDEVRDGIVSYTNHYLFTSTGEELLSLGQLRFRTQHELSRSLLDAGFEVERVYGGWDHRPAGVMTRELIVIAVR
jgi:SAM-dependent methyltransferase